MDNILSGIYSLIRNQTLNAMGVERDITQLIKDGDIGRVKSMLQNRDDIVAKAIQEYNPETHAIMNRRDKNRKGDDPYRTEKLPRTRQRYINEVELFFLLGNPIKWKLSDVESENEGFEAFAQFLKDTRFNTTMRQAKRLAGAETECAKLYHIYRDDVTFEPRVKVVVLSKSKGYTLRPLFDQYGNLLMFGYGYTLKEGTSTVEHFDIHTPTTIYRCKKGKVGWDINPIENKAGKINLIYYPQPTAWDGLQPRCDREESIDSKIGDTNNYFADPIAEATADVIEILKKSTDTPGKMIQLTGKDSKFGYINPPTSSETQQKEKDDLRQSILFDTFTPEFTPEKMVGLGTLSGEAIKRAMVLGYIKRDNRKEIYDELVDREKNLILAIMMNVTHPELRDKLKDIQIEHEFAEPFSEDITAQWQAIGNAYNNGIMSLEEAVRRMSAASNPKEEIARLQAEKQSKQTSELFEPSF